MSSYSERQQDIIDAAIDIIADGGLQSLSMRHIARKVGINESTIYSHFKSKDDLMENVIQTFMDHAVDWCKEFDQKGKSSINKLELYFKRFSSAYFNTSSRAKAYWLGLIIAKEITFEKIKAVHLYYKDWIYNTIEEGQKNGEIMNDFTAENLSSIVVGPLYLFQRRLAFDSNYDVEKNSMIEWQMIEKLLSGK